MNKQSFFLHATRTALSACKLILFIAAFLSTASLAQEQTPLDLSVGIFTPPVHTLGDVRDIQFSITYDMELRRQANGVIVTVEIPEGVTFIGGGFFEPGAHEGKPCSYAGNLLTCNVGVLVTGDRPPIDYLSVAVVRVKATRAGALTFKARITANEPDPNLSNNITTKTVTVVKSRKRVRFF